MYGIHYQQSVYMLLRVNMLKNKIDMQVSS